MENEETSQWVDQIVSFSSEFSAENWSARNLRGPPTCNNTYGDNASAWCPARYTQDEFLELRYLRSVYVSQVKIYENLNGGAVIKIEGMRQGGIYETIWSREAPENHTQYRIFCPQFEKSSFRTNQLRLTLRFTAANYFSELDAVELIGTISNISIPQETIISDFSKLITFKDFSDMTIRFSDGEVQALKAIFLVRCQKLFAYLSLNDFLMRDLNVNEFRIVHGFIYTDRFNEELMNDVIRVEKEKDVQISSNGNERITIESHRLTVNRLVRFSIKFGLARLQYLLMNFMMKSYFDKDNALDILMDSLKGDLNQIKESDINENLDTIGLEKVTQIAMDYIKLNLHDIVKTEKFEMLPKDVLLKIIKTVL